MNKFLQVFFLFLGISSFGQSVTGTTGIIHTPSARTLEDGQLILGASYIPKPYFQRYGKRINPGLNTYITYGILPFVEVMFRFTHELNVPVNTNTLYFPDRLFTIRARLLSEKKYLPAIVLGLQDASAITESTCLVCTNYSATYFVGSKNFETDYGDFDLSIGFTFDLFDLKSKDYKGVFGGISFSPNFQKNASILIEHNSKGFNSGFRYIIFSRFNLMLGIWNLDKPTFSFNFSI